MRTKMCSPNPPQGRHGSDFSLFLFPNEKDQCAPLMSCTINRAVVLLAMGRKEEAISAVLAAKKLGSTFGVASAVFAVQCVMTSASCSSYLSA